MPSNFKLNTFFPLCKRDTISYYFNDSGILTQAQPYEMRPNFDFSSDTAKLNGYMNEPASANLSSSFNSPNNTGFFINNEICTGFTDDCGRWGFTCSLNPSSKQSNPIQLAGSYATFLNSIYIQCYNFSDIEIKLTEGIDCPYITIKSNLRRYYYHGYFQPSYFNLTSNPIDIIVCGGMAEDISLEYPTSWIQYGKTRTAD